MMSCYQTLDTLLDNTDDTNETISDVNVIGLL